ncbi:MAG: hypothetical protein SVK08_04555 [Halobacteriota archaeon]|nr:hypothetical protein [Halobacteriota archaeon]
MVNIINWVTNLSKDELYFILFIMLVEMMIMLFLMTVYTIKSHGRMDSVEKIMASMVDLESNRMAERALAPIRDDEEEASRVRLDLGKISDRMIFPKEEISATIVPLNIDVVDTEGIPESMGALTRKYSLESITLASEDGILIASSSDKGEEEAAEFSFMFHETQKIRSTSFISLVEVGMYIYSIDSRDGSILCVIRSENILEKNRVMKIAEDAKAILKCWFDIDVAKIK